MLHIEIVTPTRIAWTGEATEVQVPGAQGEMGAMDGHTMLLAVTRAGVVRVNKTGGEHEDLVVGPGFAEITPLGVTLLVDRVESASQIDKEKAQRELDAAEKILGQSMAGTDEWRDAEYQADMARARLSV